MQKYRGGGPGVRGDGALKAKLYIFVVGGAVVVVFFCCFFLFVFFVFCFFCFVCLFFSVQWAVGFCESV